MFYRKFMLRYTKFAWQILPEVIHMKITVLVDNTALTHLQSEWGLSFLLEESGKRILFDLGASGLLLQNAVRAQVNLLNLNYIAISHGHNDHIWGLDDLTKLYIETGIERDNRPLLVAHPLAFHLKVSRKLEISSAFNEFTISHHFPTQFSTEPVWLTEHLVFLGEIERKTPFEAQKPIGQIYIDAKPKDDYLLDDTALAYKSPDGLVIITGCSHSGICNIVEQAKKVCGEERILDIVGGLHLLEPDEKQLQGTVDYLQSIHPTSIRACHCTDLRSKIAIAQVANLQEVGSGTVLEYA